MTEMETGAWALWHPDEGFGDRVEVYSEMDIACECRDIRTEAEGDGWKVVPVRVVRVDHT